MPNQRSLQKRKLQVWVTEQQFEDLADTAHELGFETLTDYLTWVAGHPPPRGAEALPPVNSRYTSGVRPSRKRVTR